MTPLYPLRFRPVLKDYTWGGRGLAERLGRALPPGNVAESWEISAHPHGLTPVRDGALAGATLAEVQAAWGPRLLGSGGGGGGGRFPLLVKLLDAHEWLSVQVHPDDAAASARGGDPGKTEMWVVLHAAPGAEIVLGLKEGVDREALERALAAGRLLDTLGRCPARAGDVFFVPAGTVHALGPGLIVAEIQQASDTTFRLYDWDRRDAGGRPRPLHLERALEVLDFTRVEPGPVRPETRLRDGVATEALVRCAHFDADRATLEAGAGWTGDLAGGGFEILGVLEGAARIERPETPDLELTAVDWALLPAGLGPYRVASAAGARLLRVRPPAPEADA